MTFSDKDYQYYRQRLLEDIDSLIALEQKYMEFLLKATLQAASTLYTDFCRANDLIPFWIQYAPKQRGRKPTGTSIPWSEVGEKSLAPNLLRSLLDNDPSLIFPGLPFGGDVRFAAKDAFIHFDIKLTGPHDNPNELVVPPQQISGDGLFWQEGVVNSAFIVTGQKASMTFQPKLPPFYILDNRLLVCLTYFLKAVYSVEEMGVQPLGYMEIACVPNGLLLFDGPYYAKTPGLLIPGKDDKTKAAEDKRIRVRLNPLASLDGNDRCIKLIQQGDGWIDVPRNSSLFDQHKLGRLF